MVEITKGIKGIKLFALDLDGTIYTGEKIVVGAVELIDYLRKQYQLTFFTNNSSKTAKQVFEKLKSLGIECELPEVYAVSSLMALYLKKAGIDNLYVIGSDSFRSELQANGLRIIDDDSAKNLVVGLDIDLNYRKITTALSVLLKGGKFIVCNEDSYFPVGDKRYMPGCGAMVGAIAASANKRPDFIVGKPNTYILSKISEAFGVEHHEIAVVGDSYESDVMMALNYHSKAILISPEGKFTKGDVLVMENLHKLLRCIRGC